MRRLVRALGILALVLAGVLIVGAGVAIWVVRASLPDDTGSVSVRGLEAPVTVRYDGRRRPFVQASGLADALFTEGWLHARERLWQMELLRRAGSGRMAEAFGPDMLETDRELWRAGVPQLAARLAENASPFMREQIDAYVGGVNAGMQSLRTAPPEFWLTRLDPRPWTAADVYAIGALMAYQSSNNLTNELLRFRLAAALDHDRFAAFLPDEHALPNFPYVLSVARASRLDPLRGLSALDVPLLPSVAFGSNGWVVAAGRSTTGHALFAFDSHDDLTLPNLFYEVHLFFGPDHQIRGWSLPGLPGVINGYNRHLAWGLTNIGDSEDLFVEERQPGRPHRFRGPDGWYQADVETVEIPVAGRAEPERLDIVHTRHGSLISDHPPLALSWTGHHIGDRGMDGFLAMNLAEDMDAFSAAMDRIPVPTANVTYADDAGHIGFRTMGLVPVRRSGRGLVPHAGADPDAGWSGYVPTERMPRRRDPPSGYLAAANAKVTADDDPLISADNAPGYRMRRLRRLLGAPGQLSPEDMREFQMDWYNPQASLLLPVLLPALQSAPLSSLARRSLALLERWHQDPRNDPDSAGAVVYEHFYIALADRIFGSALPPELLQRLKSNNYVLNHALDRLLLAGAQSPWWNGDRSGAIVDAFEAAVATAAGELGEDPEDWRWAAVHGVRLQHELASAVPVLGMWLSRGPYPWGGGPATLGRARYRYSQPFLARAGATVRVMADMGDPIVARAIIPGGESGHPWSPHYADQLPLWLTGELEDLVPPAASSGRPVTRLEPAR